MTLEKRSLAIRHAALELGFSKVGFAPVGPHTQQGLLDRWLSMGYHGEMAWMEKQAEQRADPRILMPTAKSVISLAVNYYTSHDQREDRGKISRYAWGDDYHDVVKSALKLLLEKIRLLEPGAEGISCVDTAPISEKYWAVRAGLGWQGKHTNVITRDHGSWVFLGEIITDLELQYDPPMKDYCGSCDRCITACPTQAIVQPYVLDSTKCISYLTIEYRGDELSIPASDFRNWIYGCDICQDVCPWNHKFSRPSGEARFAPRTENVNQTLEDLAEMTEEQFRVRFKRSAVKRTKFHGLMRNVDHLLRDSS